MTPLSSTMNDRPLLRLTGSTAATLRALGIIEDNQRLHAEIDRLRDAILKHQADVRYATQGAALSLADDALYSVLEVGAAGTAEIGSNV